MNLFALLLVIVFVAAVVLVILVIVVVLVAVAVVIVACSLLTLCLLSDLLALFGVNFEGNGLAGLALALVLVLGNTSDSGKTCSLCLTSTANFTIIIISRTASATSYPLDKSFFASFESRKCVSILISTAHLLLFAIVSNTSDNDICIGSLNSGKVITICVFFLVISRTASASGDPLDKSFFASFESRKCISILIRTGHFLLFSF